MFRTTFDNNGETDYALLRPDAWAAAHPEHIRTYRQEERRDRADRKQLQRATHSPPPQNMAVVNAHRSSN